jgi:periplasmic protein TonB
LGQKTIEMARLYARAVKPETAKPTASPRSQSTWTAAAAAAPSGGPSPSDWRSQVIGILERNKRYPPSAESNHEEGTAHLAFTINRQGRVLSAHIAGNSGSSALDAETLALVHRVSIPPPPAEVAGAQISLVVSLRYNI